MAKISLQLYSVKDATEKDFMKTLEDVKKMGYDGVEFAGFFGCSAKEVKEKLDAIGIEVSGAHVGIDELRNNIDEVIEYHKAIGNKYIIVPYAEVDKKEDAQRLNEEFKGFSKKLSENGMHFGYHNHAHEMKMFDGEYAFDIMMEGDNDMIYEVDTFWTEYAGVDTAKYLKKLAGRCPLVHLKDMDAKTRESTVYGTGILDNEKIIKAALDYCKPEWLVIEWENFKSGNCLKAVEDSIVNLKKYLQEI